MIKGFKFRIYPTKEQESEIWKHIHASRFIWNYMLALQEENYKEGGKYLSAFDMNRLLTPMKKFDDYKWLCEVSAATLQRTCIDLNEAYKRFFEGISRHPKFKNSKKAKPTYPVRSDGVWFKNNYVKIPKIGKIKIKTDFKFPEGNGHKFSNVRLSYINGKYMLSLGIECENQAPELNDYSMGIDLGIKELAVVVYGDKQYIFHNINKSQKICNIKKQIKHLQRTVSRKYEASQKRNNGKYIKTKNIKKIEAKIRKLYARWVNIRKDYIHQTTHKLISMLPKRVVMEDLDVIGMMKNKYLSRAIGEQCFYEFIRQMSYKCEWNGIQFIQADRFYPSSKTCSCCGKVKKDLKLSDRTYICSHCGFTIDRDVNAAINLSRYIV